MGILKVLGGAALGVTALVAAPVFGAVGTITVLGAAVGASMGASMGAAAGGIASRKDKEQKENIKRQGYEEGKAERTKEFEELSTKFNEAALRFRSYKRYEEFVIASFAVAISAAYCDGTLSSEEKEDIQEIVSGETYSELPEEMKAEIQKLYVNPPSLNTAMKLVKKVSKTKWSIFDDIIELVIKSDGIVRKEELAFKEAWNEFKKTYSAKQEKQAQQNVAQALKKVANGKVQP